MTIGVAVVGLGFMGRVHIASFQRSERCRVVAAVDRDPLRFDPDDAVDGNLEGIDEAFDSSSISLHASLEPVLEDPSVHAVSIATPTPTHVDLASRVIDSGRHLLVEKPVDLRVDSIRELARRAESAGVLAMPAHCMRFWPAWVWMKRLIDESTYGRCRRAAFLRRGAAPTWNRDFYLDETKSGGAVVDLHMHDTDFVLHCFGTPDAVASEGTNRYLTTRYEYETGPIVEAEGGWLEDPEAPFTMRTTLEFEDATVTFDIGRDPEVVVVGPDGEATPRPDASEGGTGYDVEIEAFLEAIESTTAVPPVTLDDAAETTRILDLEIASLSADGKRVPVSR